MNKLKVGFIGLGLMGNPMAKNILKAGFSLSVHNRSPNRLKDFKKLKVPTFTSPKKLSENVDVVITMVTGPDDVKKVMLGAEGVASGARKGLIAVDMSTIGPTTAKEIAKGLKKYGIDFLDAPVTGSTNRAQSGELTILVGGDKRVFEKVRPILKAMGKDIFYMGKTGFGQAIKLVNNLMGAITIEALAEGMLVADSLGIKRAQVLKALGNAPLISTNMRMKMPNMISNKYPVSFSLSNMRKDLRLALDESGKKLPTLAATEKLLKKGMDMGLSNQDYSAILKVLSTNE